jgi:hypothetical protein
VGDNSVAPVESVTDDGGASVEPGVGHPLAGVVDDEPVVADLPVGGGAESSSLHSTQEVGGIVCASSEESRRQGLSPLRRSSVSTIFVS